MKTLMEADQNGGSSVPLDLKEGSNMDRLTQLLLELVELSNNTTDWVNRGWMTRELEKFMKKIRKDLEEID